MKRRQTNKPTKKKKYGNTCLRTTLRYRRFWEACRARWFKFVLGQHAEPERGVVYSAKSLLGGTSFLSCFVVLPWWRDPLSRVQRSPISCSKTRQRAMPCLFMPTPKAYLVALALRLGLAVTPATARSTSRTPNHTPHSNDSVVLLCFLFLPTRNSLFI